MRTEGYITLEALIQLEPGDGMAIRLEMDELNRKRREKQPLSLPVPVHFKRPRDTMPVSSLMMLG